ncbi:putative ATP synthase subunit f, mitochondrial [Cimex lectularius]|uniref:ATP synthase subunit f, mitochondrial n=1 Tax=Cimex lectularius TaxID=79782 RepID=A0A8I6RFC3_CIMLE|nr:putative ATP synthase subunit f, mitochondrial [Cimex lectularius]
MRFGDYPAEYNPKVHGPYDPARYYGKPDTPFSQVKLGELASWVSRRNKSPSAMMGAFSRAYWRWQHKYIQPKRAGMAGLMHVACGSMIIFYYLNYGSIKGERRMRYH